MLTLEKAYYICKEITVNHYENFPVASKFLPADIRKHVYPIYAFARHADDLADEDADKDGLLEWREMLHNSTKGAESHPVFIALADTIKRFDLPVDLFDNLLSAFLQDLEKNRYKDINELLNSFSLQVGFNFHEALFRCRCFFFCGLDFINFLRSYQH